MKYIKIYNIDWDTDGETISFLPSEIVIQIPANTPNIEDTISDWLSDTFGYCHNGFDFEEAN